jgi:transposase
VELFEQLRREHEFGIGTIAGVAAKFGVHRRVVRQAIDSALPPKHRYPPRTKPKLGAVAEFIDEVLDEDRRAPRKQRHTARRLYRRILTEFPDATVAESTLLLLDDDTVRSWYELYQQGGIDGLAGFGHEGGFCRLNEAQQTELKDWITANLPRTTREVGAWIAARFGIEYFSRSGLIALLHRLGMEHRKPKMIGRKLDPARQAAFIAAYEALLNGLSADEAVLFGDAVHPAHAAHPVGCWAPKGEAIAMEQTTGREHLNIHGAIDLETGRTVMRDVLSVDATSTIMLLMAIEAAYPNLRLIHVLLDNARCHHAKLVRAWLGRPGCRIRLHFVPRYCPHLNPIERLWGLMHRNVTHNKCYPSFNEFSDELLRFLRQDVPARWSQLCDQVSDNFRVIDPTKFRIVG